MLLRLFVILGSTYILSQFLRNTVAVLASALGRDIGVGSEELGVLTGAFFMAFALTQLPMGLALDRYGPRRVMAVLTVPIAVGCAVFALAETAQGLFIGRTLMGIGCSPLLMGPMVIFARAFPQEHFATYTSWHLAIGNTGVLLATTPFAVLLDAVGWRMSFWGIAVVTALFVPLLWYGIGDRINGKPMSSGRVEGLGAEILGLLAVMKDRRLWLLMPLLFCGYGCVAVITALWGGPYLADMYGLSRVGQGNVLLLMAVGAVIGPLLFGPLDRRFNTRKWVVIPGCLVVILLFMSFAVFVKPPFWMVPVGFFLMAASTGYFSVSVAHARALYPDHAVGRGMTVSNMLVMAGVGVLQPLSGVVAGLFVVDTTGALSADAYRAIFLFLGACLALSLAIYAMAPDRPVRPSA